MVGAVSVLRESPLCDCDTQSPVPASMNRECVAGQNLEDCCLQDPSINHRTVLKCSNRNNGTTSRLSEQQQQGCLDNNRVV